MKANGHHLEQAERFLFGWARAEPHKVPALVAQALANAEAEGAIRALTEQAKVAEEMAKDSSSPFRKRGLQEFAKGMRKQAKKLEAP